jgi:processive 1,2-diacylglycerol beta-glucosyltransferase
MISLYEEDMPMIQLHDKETGAFVGTITEAQLQFLIDQLEEESTEDRDYYINQATLDLFEQRGADADLLALLRQALGTREDIEIAWSPA